MARKVSLFALLALALCALVLPSFAQDATGIDLVVVAPDVAASNGVVHVIDTVLVPPSVTAMLSGEMMATEDMMMTESMDMMATEDMSMMMTEEMMMTESMDMMATEDMSMMATEDMMMATEDMMMTEMAMELPTIWGIVSTSPDHTILASLIESLGLVETFDSAGTYTVFAPTDAAFEELVAGLGMTLEDVAANTELVTAVLSYHVIPDAAIYSADIVPPVTVTTLGGESLTINSVTVGMMDDMMMTEEMMATEAAQ